MDTHEEVEADFSDMDSWWRRGPLLSAGIGENLQDEILDYIEHIQNSGQEVVLICNINVKLLLIFL